ncbi:FAD-dependent oxidoreductase [Breoghania sp. L-A4]|uniref:flavin monoamine oxidase family protein n=1 Tax=Breoghania sp. L-A4 TaxID=2304600 RepID=UPI0013C2F264|nr:FAD-dependent oxidoreductase [Breoghania sp. L-A4]
MSRPAPISRRHIIAGLGAGLAAPFVLRSPAARAASGAPIIVIGAGIAGLSAAHALRGAGHTVIVLEANGRIGGRIDTDRSLGVAVERGANWIHGISGNPLTDIAKRAGAALAVTDNESLTVFGARGETIADAELGRAESRYSDMLAEIDEELEASDDQPLATALRDIDAGFLKDPVMRWVSSSTEDDVGAPIEAASAYYFDEDEVFPGADAILPDGYDAVLAPLAIDLDIRLTTPVTRITQGDGRVIVETPDGPVDGAQAICAVPLGVLKAGNITFDPPLPDGHADAIKRIGFGTVTKAAVAFDAPFWPIQTQFFGHLDETRGRWPTTFNLRPSTGRNILMMIATGAYAQRADAMDPGALKADLTAVLRAMFGDGTPEPAGIVASAWSRDPHTLGAYSFPAVGSKAADFDHLAKSVSETLSFAGEHVGFAYHGTAHGAHLSGLKAAATVLQRL